MSNLIRKLKRNQYKELYEQYYEENRQLKKNINNAIWGINNMLANYPFTDSYTDMKLWGFLVDLRTTLESDKE